MYNFLPLPAHFYFAEHAVCFALEAKKKQHGEKAVQDRVEQQAGLKKEIRMCLSRLPRDNFASS